MRTSDSGSDSNSNSDSHPLYFLFSRHSPGRFFAANELKLMLAHIVLHYDVRSEVPGAVPPVRQFGQNTAPSTTARVLFRKRQQ